MYFINSLIYITLGKVIAFFCYDKKYLNDQYFKFGQSGWKWVVVDGLNKIFKGINKDVPWPVAKDVRVVNWKNITFSNKDLHIFHTYGTYFQAINAKINIGEGTYIAPNVGIITTNHDINDLKRHVIGKDIKLGKNCWIGMNSVILPGVCLEDGTIVGAGSVVTKSFYEKDIVIAGNPAKKIKKVGRQND